MLSVLTAERNQALDILRIISEAQMLREHAFDIWDNDKSISELIHDLLNGKD